MTVFSGPSQRIWRRAFRAQDAGWSRFEDIHLGGGLSNVPITRADETLTYYAFSEEHWRRIRSNNPPECILREIRRRTRVVGVFPDGQSALYLAAARLRHIAGTAWSTKRYLNIELLKDQAAAIAVGVLVIKPTTRRDRCELGLRAEDLARAMVADSAPPRRRSR
jgi:hypothetical protein